VANATPEDRERFKREARILASLNHPNIPAIYDVQFEEEVFRIVFQWIDGITLRAVVAEGPPSLEGARRWFVQTAMALEHAHEKGVIHRDIKPENLMIAANRRHCYLVDFGIALSVQDRRRITGSDVVVGTQGYMAPEYEEQGEVHASCDVYSMGVCLYEALSGHRIPPGEYVELSVQSELVPPSIDSLVLECIAPKSQRIQTAREFATRLVRATDIPHAPLSEVLVEGHLQDIAVALTPMSPSEFMQLKKGQRLVVLNKALGVIEETDPKLERARLHFLRILPRLALLVEPDTYRRIIGPALLWGFERPVGEWTGDRQVREALEEASQEVSGNHGVLTEEMLNYLGDARLENRPPWFYHTAREIVYRLMCNPNCSDEHAETLNVLLLKLNKLQQEASETTLFSRPAQTRRDGAHLP